MKTPLACFLQTTTRLCTRPALPYSLLPDEVQSKGILRGPVEPFRTLIQSGQFGLRRAVSQSLQVGHESIDWTSGCHYLTVSVLTSILCRVGSFHGTPLLGVCFGSSLALLGMRLGVARVVSTRCFLFSKWIVAQCIT